MKINYKQVNVYFNNTLQICKTHTLTRASNDSIVRNLDSVIKLSKRLSDIQSLDVLINSASLDV